MSGSTGEPEATPRQILYGLVAAGFLVVVIILVIGAAVAGIVPTWWSVSLALLLVVAGAWTALNWRRTGPALLVAIGLFVTWMVGTIVLAT